MECSCFSANIDEESEILFDKIVTARKTHKCYECGRDIVAGEKYRYEKTKYDDEITTIKTCLDCVSIRKHLVCDFYWGQVWDLVSESIDYYSDDNQPWSAISRLTPAARAKVCEIIERTWDAYGD